MIIITRPLAQALNTKRILTANGLSTICYPLLEIIPHTYIPYLQAEYGIITSQNAIDVIAAHQGHNIQWLVVGEKTAQKVKQQGGKLMLVANDVVELINLIKRNVPKSSDIVYYRGVDITEDISTSLSASGFQKIIERVVYQAVEKKRINNRLYKLLANDKKNYILFYSTRTAEIFIKLTKKWDYSNCIAVCISEKVAAKVSDKNWLQVIIASEKNEQAILQLVNDHER